MDSRLKDLTEKLYKEGVVKAQEEADRLLEQTKRQVQMMESEAQSKAEDIIKHAKTEAETIAKNAQSELKLASTQALTALKQEVTNLIANATFTEDVKKSMKDEHFMNNLIVETVSAWSKNEDVNLFIDKNKANDIKTYFATHAKQLLDKGVNIDASNKIKGGFKIGPSDGSYQVSFTDEDFANYFKEYLRPTMVEILFSNKKQ